VPGTQSYRTCLSEDLMLVSGAGIIAQSKRTVRFCLFYAREGRLDPECGRVAP
jgi:hypothetical protein